MRLSVAQLRLFLKDLMTEAADDDPVTKDLAKQALDGNDDARYVLADKMREKNKTSYAIILMSDDDKDRQIELLGYLAGEESEDFKSPDDWQEGDENSEIAIAFRAALNGDPSPARTIVYTWNGQPQTYAIGWGDTEPGDALTMYDFIIGLQQGMTSGEEPPTAVPSYIVKAVMSMNDPELNYMLGRCNLRSQDAERLADSPVISTTQWRTLSGLAGLADNRRFVREYWKRFLATTNVPGDFDCVITCIDYAAPELRTEVQEFISGMQGSVAPGQVDLTPPEE